MDAFAKCGLGAEFQLYSKSCLVNILLFIIFVGSGSVLAEFPFKFLLENISIFSSHRALSIPANFLKFYIFYFFQKTNFVAFISTKSKPTGI